jgi:hypothetical protein
VEKSGASKGRGGKINGGSGGQRNNIGPKKENKGFENNPNIQILNEDK